MNSERDQPVDGIILVFWMPHRGIGESIVVKITWPRGYDPTRMRVSLEQVQWVQMQSPVEQQFEVVEQDKPVRSGKAVFKLLEQLR